MEVRPLRASPLLGGFSVSFLSRYIAECVAAVIIVYSYIFGDFNYIHKVIFVEDERMGR